MVLNNLKTILTVLLTIVLSGQLNAQNIEIKGKIVDAETNQPVEFANIGVVGTYMGTATDFDGNYMLTVGESFVNYKVQISAVSYKVKEFTVDELHVLSGEAIKLFKQTYGIEQVEVTADSKRLYGILKTASNVIGENYEKAYSANVFLNQNVNGNLTEAVINYSDDAGYGNRSMASAYENRNYTVEEVRRDFTVTPLKEGIIYANDLQAFDIIRQRGNVLDVEVVDDYELELIEEAVINGDSAWVIRYSIENPTLAHTGDAYCSAYKGIITIRTKDYAVLRNELEFENKGFFHAGRDAYKAQAPQENYKCKVVSEYRTTENDKLALSKISYNGSDAATNLKIDWIVYQYNAKAEGGNRDFYSDKSVNKDFWNRFTLPQ